MQNLSLLDVLFNATTVGNAQGTVSVTSSMIFKRNSSAICSSWKASRSGDNRLGYLFLNAEVPGLSLILNLGAFNPSGGKLGLNIDACLCIISCNSNCLINKGFIALLMSSLLGIYDMVGVLCEGICVVNACRT